MSLTFEGRDTYIQGIAIKKIAIGKVEVGKMTVGKLDFGKKTRLSAFLEPFK